MVFWKTYPISNVIETWYNQITQKKFISQQFQKKSVASPTNVHYELATLQHLDEIREYLKMYFGKPPFKPLLDIPQKYLLCKGDHLLFVRDKSGKIAGTLRYHYIGRYKEEIYCVDCFCIHPQWKRKGVGDYLLTELHHYVNKWNIPYSVFLKEGAQLSIIHPPLYHGIYVYREISHDPSTYVQNISIKVAFRLMEIWKQINPDVFIIANRNSSNQIWRLYKKDHYTVIACIQDAYQSINGKKIGWITGWLESPDITDTIRTEASKEISESAPYDYIWMNKLWTTDMNMWKVDGSFYWYSYQWTSYSIGRSYCIMN